MITCLYIARKSGMQVERTKPWQECLPPCQSRPRPTSAAFSTASIGARSQCTLALERPFYFEKNPSLLIERLRHNVSFFYLNYMVLTAVWFCLMAVWFCLRQLLSIQAFIWLALIGAAWVWMIRASADGTLRVGGE
jgi:hypothetical protein